MEEKDTERQTWSRLSYKSSERKRAESEIERQRREQRSYKSSERQDAEKESKRKEIEKLAYRDKYALKSESNDDWITDKQAITLLGVPIVLFTVLFTIVYVYDYVDYNTALGVQTIGICGALLTIVIVLFALDNNESKIEAAGEAWLMLTVLGAIFAIILYLVIF